MVSLIGACLDPPNLCMVMELCDHSLFHVLHNANARLGVAQLVKIAVRKTSDVLYAWLC